MGLIKGETPVTEKIIAEMSEKIKEAKGSTVTSLPKGNSECSCGSKC
jgi:hypothetical protein